MTSVLISATITFLAGVLSGVIYAQNIDGGTGNGTTQPSFTPGQAGSSPPDPVDPSTVWVNTTFNPSLDWNTTVASVPDSNQTSPYDLSGGFYPVDPSTAWVVNGTLIPTSDWNATVDTNRSRVVQGSAPDSSQTTGLPDVTATSQNITLLKTSPPPPNISTAESPTNFTTNNETSNSTTTTETTTNLEITTLGTLNVTADVSTTVNSTEPSGNTSVNESTTTAPLTSTKAVVDSSSIIPTTTQSPNVTEDGNSNQQVGDSTIHNVLLIFNASCETTEAESILAQLDNVTSLANKTGNQICDLEVHLRMSVSNTSVLKDLLGIAKIQRGGAVLTLVGVQELDTHVGDSTTEDNSLIPWVFSGPFSNREIITYAVVGAIFGLTIILVLVLLCCKCCVGDRRRKRSQDIPHLSMRLEDYSLTRIPRPSTFFNVRNGAATSEIRPHQSFETSVVPIDDDMGSLRRGNLRSFSGRRHKHRTTETDDDIQSKCSSVRAGSTERLARDFEKQRAKRGTENQVFRF